MKILLVEHNILAYEQLKKMLKQNSVECDLISCRNGAEAMEIAPKKRPELVIMDIHQPCINSLVVLKILKKIDTGIYFIMLFDPKHLMLLEKAISLGVDDYLIKPFKKAELISHIKTAVSSKEKSKRSFISAKTVRNNKENLCVRADFSHVRNLKLIKAKKKILEEIAARKKAEDALRKSAERYWEIVKLIPGAIIVHSRDKIVFANPAAAKLLNVAGPQMFLGKSLLNYVHPGFRKTFQEQIRQLIKYSRAHHKMEAKFIKNDGTDLDVELISSSCSCRGEPLIHTFIHNVTERKRIEIELQKADKLESISMLISGIAHDFNNFLANMLGNIALAKIYKDNPDKISEKLDIIEKATLQAKELTRRLSDFFKGGDTVKKVTNIKELIIDSARFALSGSNVSYDFSFSEELLPLKIDAAQIGQVINNIIINAAQAMPQGGTILIKAENVVLGAPPKNHKRLIPLPKGKYVKISIKDEGVGIPEENLQKIFEPFFSTKPGGSGLGLATSHAIVKKHDGYIDVHSRVGVGTTLEIYLPAKEPGKEPVMDSEESRKGLEE